MKFQLVLSLRVMQWQGSLSMSMVHITIRDHVDILDLGRGLGPFTGPYRIGPVPHQPQLLHLYMLSELHSRANPGRGGMSDPAKAVSKAGPEVMTASELAPTVVALGRADPAPHLGNPVEPSLVVAGSGSGG